MSTEPLESSDPPARPSLPDEEVVERVLSGDTALFEILMRRYNRRLFRTVRSMGLQEAEAEDVLQETYVRAYQHLGQFERRARFSTWLTRIAIHEVLSRQRRSRRFTDLEDLELEHDGGRTPEERASSAEMRGVLEHAIERLPEGLRLVFVLREVEGLDTGETSDCLGISADNVKVRLHRARSLLRSRIDRQLGAEVRQLHQFAGERCDRIVRVVLNRLAPGGEGKGGTAP